MDNFKSQSKRFVFAGLTNVGNHMDMKYAANCHYIVVDVYKQKLCSVPHNSLVLASDGKTPPDKQVRSMITRLLLEHMDQGLASLRPKVSSC